MEKTQKKIDTIEISSFLNVNKKPENKNLMDISPVPFKENEYHYEENLGSFDSEFLESPFKEELENPNTQKENFTDKNQPENFFFKKEIKNQKIQKKGKYDMNSILNNYKKKLMKSRLPLNHSSSAAEIYCNHNATQDEKNLISKFKQNNFQSNFIGKTVSDNEYDIELENLKDFSEEKNEINFEENKLNKKSFDSICNKNKNNNITSDIKIKLFYSRSTEKDFNNALCDTNSEVNCNNNLNSNQEIKNKNFLLIKVNSKNSENKNDLNSPRNLYGKENEKEISQEIPNLNLLKKYGNFSEKKSKDVKEENLENEYNNNDNENSNSNLNSIGNEISENDLIIHKRKRIESRDTEFLSITAAEDYMEIINPTKIKSEEKEKNKSKSKEKIQRENNETISIKKQNEEILKLLSTPIKTVHFQEDTPNQKSDNMNININDNTARSMFKNDFASLYNPYNSYILSIGGKSDTQSRKFNTENNQWNIIKEFKIERSDFVALMYKEKRILILGGKSLNHNGIESVSDTIDLLSTDDLNFVRLDFKLKIPRSNFGAVYLDYKLYIAGGYNGRDALNNFEYFDKKLKKWIDLPKLLGKKKEFGFILGADKNIYCIGGSDERE